MFVGTPQPLLAVFPTLIDISADVGPGSAAELITIANTGTGALDYSITSALASSWLSLSKTAGSVPDSLWATVSFDGLAAGIYEDTLIVVSVRWEGIGCRVFVAPIVCGLESPMGLTGAMASSAYRTTNRLIPVQPFEKTAAASQKTGDADRRHSDGKSVPL